MPLTSWNLSLIKSKNLKSLERGTKLPSLEPLYEGQKQNISSRGKKEKHLKPRILCHSKQRQATPRGKVRTLRRFHIQDFTLPDLKTYNNVIIVKTVWYQCKERHMGQWNRIESKSRFTQKQSIDFQQRCQRRKDSLFKKRCQNYPKKKEH